MKKAFLENGIDIFNEHQILEMLLFFSKPQGDTNPAAHRLIDTFGSLKNVLEADHGELCKVDGVGEHTAVLIGFVRELAKKYAVITSLAPDVPIVDTEVLRGYFESLFLGMKNEEIHALLLDNDLHIVKSRRIIDGSPERVQISARSVADFVIKNDCSRVVLAHNHPNGIGMPSRTDVEVTAALVYLLSELDIILCDHIIVGKDGSCSMRTLDRQQRKEKRIWKE